MARALWRRTVGGVVRPAPAQAAPFSQLSAWLGSRAAIHHVKQAAPSAHAEGRFDDLVGDVARGVPACLRFLAATIGDGSGEAAHAMQYPHVETALGDRLSGMSAALRDAGCTWQWDLRECKAEAKVDQLFVIFGAARTGVDKRQEINILGVLGQQLVLSPEQTKHFLDKDSWIRSRIEVMHEILFDDMVVVADASVIVSQCSELHCPGRPRELEEWPRSVTHSLRLEMQLTVDKASHHEEYEPDLQPSAWQLVDWNGVCVGNHPALPKGVSAPW